jgi:hypothetical protein
MAPPGPDSGPRALAALRGARETPQVGRPAEAAVQGFGCGQCVSSATDRVFGCGPAQENRHGCDVRAKHGRTRTRRPRVVRRGAASACQVGFRSSEACPGPGRVRLVRSALRRRVGPRVVIGSVGGRRSRPSGSGWAAMCTRLQNREAHESHGRRQSGNGAAAQRTHGRSKASRSAERQFGNGEGAAAGGDAGTASREGRALEGEASVGTPRPTGHRQVVRRGWKPGEPHGRQRDATSSRNPWRSKPSRW